jgi:hypothetical protein
MPGVRVMRGLLPVIFSSLAFAATSVLICTFIDSEIICLLVQLICLAFYVLIHKVLKTEGYQFLMSLAGSGFKFRRIN